MSVSLHSVLLVSRSAMLQEAFALSRALLARNNGRVTLLLAGSVATAIEGAELADSAQFEVQPEACGDGIRPRGPWRVGPFRTLALVFSISRKRRVVASRLRSLKPDILIVFEDRFMDPEAIWLAEAWLSRLPVVLIKYASSSMESDVWSRRGRHGYSLDTGMYAWLRRFFARRYPEHVIESAGRRLLFYPTWDSWALVICGMANVNLRVVGGGNVSKVAVQSPFDRDESEKASGLYGRFVVTGLPSLDGMTLYRSVPDSTFRIVCALPQWAEHGQLDWERHMELLNDLTDILEASGCEVILSLHPKADSERYRPLANRHGLKISDRSLTQILPSANIFLASWSSTLRWSAMLGIPSINLDWIGQAYTYSEASRSSVLSTGPDDLVELLNRMIADNDYRRSLSDALKRESAFFGTADGQACGRVLNLIDEVVEHSGDIGEAK